MIERLHVIGPVRGTSGYDRHTRAFVQSFVQLGVEVELTHLHGWSRELPAAEQPAWLDALAAPVGAGTTLHFTMPHQVAPVAGTRTVNYTMFEADRIPAAWARLAREHDAVVLPTAACRDAWIAGGVEPERLRLAPLGVDGAYLSQPAEPLDLRAPDGTPVRDFGTRFLTIAEPRPRKNLLALLRVWSDATRRGDDAVLIVKLTPFHASALEQFAADVHAQQQTGGRRAGEAAPVVLLADVLPDDAMRSLFASATHYVSLSHGEGWDMPMAEAAVAGLRLVAPRHTAYVEYLREDEVEFVPARPAPYRCEGRMGPEDAHFFDGRSWWDPDEQAAADAIARIVAGRGEAKLSPAARIADECSWERSARRLLDVLDATPPPRRERAQTEPGRRRAMTTTSYLDSAAAAADMLTTKWLTAEAVREFVPVDYWKTPTMAAELVTFMRLAGDQRHLAVCDAARDAGAPYLTSCGWLDDADTWGRFGVQAYEWLHAIGSGDAGSYLSMGTTVGDDLQAQWDDTCGGGLYWMRDPSADGNFKASNATLGLMEIALGLDAIAPDPARRTWGERCWAWMGAKQLVDAHGLVWGGLSSSTCTVLPDNIPVLQLQGAALKPLWSLYVATGDASLLDAAQRIVAGAFAQFTWQGTPILSTPQDIPWATATEQWKLDHVNDTLFKGIFIAYLGELTVNLAGVAGREQAAAGYAAAIRANADSLLANYRQPVYGMDWYAQHWSYVPEPDPLLQACLQYSALAAFDAAAAVASIG